MKKSIDFTRVLIVIVMIALVMSGCTESENRSEGKQQITTVDYKVREIPFASNLSLEKNESIRILDVNNDNVFMKIEKKVKNVNDPMAIDMVFLADRLLIYNIKEQKITYERKIDENFECNSGILLKKGIVFVMMSLSKDSYGEYSFYHVYNDKETVFASAKGSPDGYYDPQMIKLPYDNFAYTYYNPDSEEFGVNVVTQDFKVHEIKKMTNGNGWKFMRTSLSSNGEDYIYFYDRQGTGWFLIGDKNSTISQFRLAEDERINDYCMLDGSLLFSMNLVDQEGIQKGKLILKNSKGKDINEKNHDALYRMTSNKKDVILATDGFFKNHIIRINGKKEIILQDLTVDDRLEGTLDNALDGTAVKFYHISGNKFLLFFYDSEFKLIEVEIN